VRWPLDLDHIRPRAKLADIRAHSAYFRVAAIDLSGMGDSGWRAHYNSELRAEEIRAVIAAAQLGELSTDRMFCELRHAAICDA
jgi:pimeloyl-ACP methyl ester carboxylesterase